MPTINFFKYSKRKRLSVHLLFSYIVFEKTHYSDIC